MDWGKDEEHILLEMMKTIRPIANEVSQSGEELSDYLSKHTVIKPILPEDQWLETKDCPLPFMPKENENAPARIRPYATQSKIRAEAQVARETEERQLSKKTQTYRLLILCVNAEGDSSYQVKIRPPGHGTGVRSMDMSLPPTLTTVQFKAQPLSGAVSVRPDFTKEVLPRF